VIKGFFEVTYTNSIVKLSSVANIMSTSGDNIANIFAPQIINQVAITRETLPVLYYLVAEWPNKIYPKESARKYREIVEFVESCTYEIFEVQSYWQEALGLNLNKLESSSKALATSTSQFECCTNAEKFSKVSNELVKAARIPLSEMKPEMLQIMSEKAYADILCDIVPIIVISLEMSFSDISYVLEVMISNIRRFIR